MGIRYQLPNGKYVYLTLEQTLDMDNIESIQEFMADDSGYDSEDPFDDSHDHGRDPIVYEVPDTNRLKDDIVTPELDILD